ncbi:DUF4345 family protein [Hyphobacterium sp.]|uniref:DUF4345 family protein n=1 Tax=Hyphobacterium sp. TaxID=2004662 RepID=UPI003BAA372E
MSTVLSNIPVLFAVLGAGLGLGALISPRWAAKLVRMQADPARPEGYAEFRATFGGVFLFLHLAFLVAIYLGQGVIGAAAVLSFGWGGAAFGRILSMILDGAKVRTRHNIVSVVVELAAAAGFALPVLGFVTNPPA